MDKSQKIWVNELYLLKFTVCRLTNRVRKLENFVAYSLDNMLATIEDKIKILEAKAFTPFPDINNSNNLPPQPQPQVQVKLEENLSQINHETIVPSPFIDDLHGVCSAVKDSDILTLAESLAEFEPIINDPEAMAYYSLGGETDRSVFEIMDFEAAQQLLLAPLINEADVLQLQHQQKSLVMNNSEVLTPVNHPVTVNTASSSNLNTNEGIAMIIDFQPPSPSHEVEITEYSEVTISDEVIPLTNTCEIQNTVTLPFDGNSNTIVSTNTSVTDVKSNHIPVLTSARPLSKKEKPSTSLKKHIKNGKSNPEAADSPDGAFLCSQCGKQFTTMANLKRHAHSHEQKVFYPCTLCKRRYESESRLNRHKAEKHPPKTPSESEYYCEYCKIHFNNPFAFTNHRLNVHPGE